MGIRWLRVDILPQPGDPCVSFYLGIDRDYMAAEQVRRFLYRDCL